MELADYVAYAEKCFREYSNKPFTEADAHYPFPTDPKEIKELLDNSIFPGDDGRD